MNLLLLSLGALILSSSTIATRIQEEEEERNIRRFNTPFISCGADPSGKGSCLVLDKNIYQSLLQMPVDALIEFNQFQTERNSRSILLRLKRFTASDNGDDLDKVVLLRGTAFEEEDDDSSFEMKPSRTAFIALSPYGSNGMIELMNSTFILSTPNEIQDDESEKDNERRINNNEYTLSLRSQAQKFLSYMKSDLKEFNRNYVSVIFSSAILDRPILDINTDYLLPPPEAFNEEGGYKIIPKSSGAFLRTFKVASDVDYEMYKRKGSNRDATSSYYYTLVGHTSSIFKRDFGHDFVSSYLKVYTQPDPYPASSALTYMQKNWSPTSPARSFATLIATKAVGGSAYLRTLCNTNWAYAVNGGMVGSYPIPVQSYNAKNGDINLYTHEVGHIWGARHTHDFQPPLDKCNVPPCPPTKATVMSYCHLCQGGEANIELAFHSKNKDEVKQYVNTLTC